MKQAVVTGAGGAIGGEIARQAAVAGYRVGVLDVDGAAAEATAATIDGAIPLEADTRDPGAVERALDAFDAAPDLVVNGAAAVRFGPLLDLSVDDFRLAVDVNLVGTFVVARAAARRMIDAGGSIVNITSINGVVPGPGAGSYGSTKAAVALLTQQMAIEWAPYGIRVNAVAPGFVDAGMSARFYADPRIRAERTARVPLGRLGLPTDVASVVLFLASDAASYVTAQSVVVDGGAASAVIASLPRVGADPSEDA